VSDLDLQEWKLRRARGVIEEYVRGIKRRASDINWVIGVLKGAFGVSKEEALMIVEQIKNDKVFIRDSRRLERLEELKKRIEIEVW
jgi:hypothetical protein